MRVNKRRKIVFLAVFIICSILFNGCADYGYFFHYSVDGANGEITVQSTESFNPDSKKCSESSLCELNCPDNSFIVCLRGGKGGSRELTFVATPKDGYRVKEWIFNGEHVKDNKTNFYTATVSYKENYSAVITVKFEPL